MKNFPSIKNSDFILFIVVIIFCYYKHITSIDHLSIFYAIFEDLIILLSLSGTIVLFSMFKRALFLVILCFSLFCPIIDISDNYLTKIIEYFDTEKVPSIPITFALLSFFISSLIVATLGLGKNNGKYIILCLIIPVFTVISYNCFLQFIKYDFNKISSENEILFSSGDPHEILEDFCETRKCTVFKKDDDRFEVFVSVLPDYVVEEINDKDQEIFRTRWFEKQEINGISIKLPNYLIFTDNNVIHVEDKENFIRLLLRKYDDTFKFLCLIVLTFFTYFVFCLRLFTKQNSIKV